MEVAKIHPAEDFSTDEYRSEPSINVSGNFETPP